MNKFLLRILPKQAGVLLLTLFVLLAGAGTTYAQSEGYSISIFSTNGEVDYGELDINSVAVDTEVTLKFTPNEHYKFDRDNLSITTADNNDVFFDCGDPGEDGAVEVSFTMPANDVTVDVTFVECEKHSAIFCIEERDINNEFYEGEDIEIPEDPGDICGWEFAGWVESKISGATTVEPDFVDTEDIQMGEEDMYFYAVFSVEKTNGNTYYATDENSILPPNVVSLTFDGYRSGTGTEDDPYIFEEDDELEVEDATSDHYDPDSELEVKFEDYYSEFTYYEITESGDMTIYARYNNQTVDRAGEEYEVTIYVAVKHDIEVEGDSDSGLSINTDYTQAIPGTTITITYSVSEHYHIDEWNVVDEDGNTVEGFEDDGNGTATFTMPDSDVSISAYCVEDESHMVTFVVYGSNDEEPEVNFYVGEDVTFPEDPADIYDKTFVGWVDSEIEGTTDDEPTFVDTDNVKMGEDDMYFYAVFATDNGDGTYFGYCIIVEEPSQYQRKMANEWGTLCLPQDIEYKADNGNYKLYYLSAVSDMEDETKAKLTFTEYEDESWIDAGTPMAIKAVGDKTDDRYTIAIDYYSRVDDCEPKTVEVGDYEFTGTLEAKSNTRNFYFYFIAQNQFWYAEDYITIPANRAWIEYTGGGQAPARFSIVEADGNEVESITTVKGETSGVKATKHLIDGHLYILRDGKTFDAMGSMVK